MNEHTPTPWHTLPEEVDKPYIRIRGNRLGSRYKIANVLTPIYDGAPPREADETRANAEFIVRACNSYADLVAALEYMTAGYGSCSYMDEKDRRDCPDIIYANKVLAKAKAS